MTETERWFNGQGRNPPWGKKGISHVSAAAWAAEVDEAEARKLRRSDPKHLKKVRDLVLIRPSEVEALAGYKITENTSDYVRRLDLIHRAFFGRTIPVAAAEGAYKHQAALQGLDPFAALVLCLDFSVRQIARQRKKELRDLREDIVADQIEDKPIAVESLIALRPWADGATAYVKLVDRGVIPGIPRTPLLAPPLSDPAYFPLQFWVTWKWINSSDKRLESRIDGSPLFEWNDWTDVMFLKSSKIPAGLAQRIDQFIGVDANDQQR